LYSSLKIIRIIKSKRMRWVGYVAQMGDIGYWWESQDVGGWIILK
jgi:hypothetical protein